MKTKEEIEQQITNLKGVRPKVRPHSDFGDDHLAALDAQVRVLEEDMESEDIWFTWPEGEYAMNIREAADEARNWLDGESEFDDLTKDWPLI
ncbi:unnamed protein product [marine sediment metagenome]|uniref:Uncharacterized protein n=1 Tax=marine sediment metagenome TaxID=412755 RepID=X1FMB6_9ZZZZ